MKERKLLGMAIMCLPRMELFHLPQWIEYHARMGATHFWVWVDGDRPNCDNFGNNGIVWNKKPDAYYCGPDMDIEVINRAYDFMCKTLAEKHDVTIHCDLTRNIAGCDVHRNGARQGILLAETRRLAVDHVEWLSFLDTDELLVGDLEALRDEEREIIAIPQRIMEDRFRDKIPVLFEDLTASHGMTWVNNKMIFRTEYDQGAWQSTHFPGWGIPEGSKASRGGDDPLHFLHFHGLENYPRGFAGKDVDYGELAYTTETCTDHLKFLKDDPDYS